VTTKGKIEKEVEDDDKRTLPIRQENTTQNTTLEEHLAYVPIRQEDTVQDTTLREHPACPSGKRTLYKIRLRGSILQTKEHDIEYSFERASYMRV